MKRFLPYLLLAALATAFAPGAFAQAYSEGDHAEVGIYGNFFRLNDTRTDFAGLGGRASFNVHPVVQLEAEMTYNFDQAFTETFSNGATAAITTSNFRTLDALFGPKFQTNKGPVRLFVTAKGGFINFMFDNRNPTFGTFASSVQGLRTNNVNGVFYPGAGAEAFFGPFGLRLDVGDEMYFNHGTHNNLRIAFGPTIRF